ncbi:MAG: 16S rRNA (guanine(966)-N(2))-methyltransferase RsmD [Candidatus Omnitrophota bacterium]|nr:MAG: 16S rRNA (guanine(966)-N(2))-methyltransferase RsmD [Candidatus Omnitrophota bacterium]RKY46542.1 MAG: 16S rRNA (guanine(966)-N(2))-methyltransferase RsmD [Candidatus Omnitrophota bacterium]HDN86520.1 16S rRNA (guanine(966)-N(2))-methyltransferase RsmD [Candidatus Omnitrophota bacterium]
MKVIRGIFKNRYLSVPKGIRAVSLRVKKSLFDLIKEEVVEAKVLDLFSGSGSLGIEALSLGAKEAVLVDIKKSSIDTIYKNLAALKVSAKATPILKDAFKAIKDFYAQEEKFDVIFLDPPYYKGFSTKSLQTLDEYDILASSGLVVVTCYYKDSVEKEFKRFSKILSKKYGQTLLLIYRKNEESSLSRNI